MLPYCPALLSIQCCWFYWLLCGKIYDDDDDDAPRRRCLRSANRNCLTVDQARKDVGRSTTPAQQSVTRCQMNLDIRTASIVFNGSWKQQQL